MIFTTWWQTLFIWFIQLRPDRNKVNVSIWQYYFTVQARYVTIMATSHVRKYIYFFIILTQENTNRTSRHITIDNSQVIFSHQDYTHPTLTNFPFFCLPLAFINPNHCLCSHNTQCLIFYFIFHSLSVWFDVENDFRILSYYKIQMDVAVKSPYVQQNIHLNSYFFLSQKTERKFSHSLLSIFFPYILHIWIFERPFEYLFCKS